MPNEISLDYADFKVIAIRKKFFWQLQSTPTQYTISGYDDPDKFITNLFRVDPHIPGIDWAVESANLADFEANYLSDCNRPNTISPTAATTQFYGRTIEMEAGATMGYCEWDLGCDCYVSKVLPMPIDAQKGDTLDFEIWTLPGVLADEPVKVGQYGYAIPIRGSIPLGWIYGSGGGEIKSFCAVRCVYTKLAGSARDFNVIAEFLV
jgi:hypothetical protein